MGATIVVVIALGLLLVLSLISWRIAVLPRRLLTLIKKERAGDDAQTQALLLEAAAVKIGPLLVGIRTFHEQAAASLRTQLVEAEARARFAERQVADASTYLDASAALVSDLRRLHDELRSAAPLPSEPAMIAAGLVPRAPVESTRYALPRSPTLRGVSAAPRVGVLEAPSQVALPDEARISERPSDPDGERTCVGPRPPPEALSPPAAKRTLLSMGAVAPPGKPAPPPAETEAHAPGKDVSP